MGYTLWKFILLALAVSSREASPAHPNIANQTFEVDLVFPRPFWQSYAMRDMQTFKANEIIPLVLAVQNLTDWEVDNLKIRWEWFILSLSASDYNQTTLLDHGRFETVDATKTDPAFLVAVTNSSTWYQNDTYLEHSPKSPGDTYMLQWAAYFDTPDFRCYYRHRRDELPNFDVYGNVAIFDVLSESEQLRANFSTAAIAIPLAPQCPESNGLFQIYGTSNATETECPVEIATVVPATPLPEGTHLGNPCAIQIDNAIASSISSRVASVTSAWAAPPTTTTRSVPTSTSSGGAGAVLPVQTAMAAAACLLCGLALS